MQPARRLFNVMAGQEGRLEFAGRALGRVGNMFIAAGCHGRLSNVMGSRRGSWKSQEGRDANVGDCGLAQIFFQSQ